MNGKIKCAWCGQILAITNKGRPRQHINGRTTCVGASRSWPESAL